MKKAVIPLAGFVLACAFVAYEAHLRGRLRSVYHAQLSLVRVDKQVNELQGIPWNIENPSYGTPQSIRRRIARTEAQIERTVHGLRRSAPTRGLDSLEPPLRTNFVAVRKIYEMGLARGGWNDPRARSIVAVAQNRTLAQIRTALTGAEQNYARDAASASRAVQSRGIAGMFVLFAAFAVFYVRFTRTAERQRRTLDELELAQEERARLLERTVEVAEHERIRLAVDLHDGPIQHLTALAFNIDRLSRRIAAGDLHGAQELAAAVRGALSTEMQSLRQLMVELRPPILDEGGLSAAIGDAAARTLGDTSTAWGVTSSIEEHLAPELETVVYRVATEALTNVRKHAKASRVDVVIGRTAGGDVSVTVTDDGVGFDPDRIERADGNHYGLLGISERVGGLGGACEVVSRPGVGTSIRATLPFKARGAVEDQVTYALAA